MGGALFVWHVLFGACIAALIVESISVRRALHKACKELADLQLSQARLRVKQFDGRLITTAEVRAAMFDDAEGRN